MGGRRTRTAVRALLAAALAIVVVSSAFVWWASTPLGPAEEALLAMRSDDAVTVTDTGDRVEFRLTDDEPHAGIIIYPGGRVDYRSYAPLARELASLGYLVSVVRMPLNLAVLAPSAADSVMADHPEVQVWGLVGHSLGGAMAAWYADDDPDVVALALLAAYPPPGTDLSDDDIAVVSVYGTRDGVLNAERAEKSVEYLPPGTGFVPVVGGNHAQFGAYGDQPGDNPAMIPAEEQWYAAADEIAMLMRPFRLQTLSP